MSKANPGLYGKNQREEHYQSQMEMCDWRDYYVGTLPLHEHRIRTDIICELSIVIFVLFTEQNN